MKRATVIAACVLITYLAPARSTAEMVGSELCEVGGGCSPWGAYTGSTSIFLYRSADFSFIANGSFSYASAGVLGSTASTCPGFVCTFPELFPCPPYTQACGVALGQSCPGVWVKAFDFVVYNKKIPSKTLLKKYVDEGEPVLLGGEKINKSRKLIGADLLNKEAKKAVYGDILQRTLIRHDSDKLAKVIMKILK